MDDKRTPDSKVVERLKSEVDRLSGELNKALTDSVYMPMSAAEYQAYEEKSKEIKKIRQELEQLLERQKQPPSP